MNGQASSKTRTSLFGTTCVILAPPLSAVSLGAFGWFMVFGPFDLVRLDLTEPWLLIINGGLSGLFFVQHSGMVRTPFRQRTQRWRPGAPWMPAYSLASSVVLLAVLGLWQGPLTMLWSAEPPWRWVIRSLFALGAIPLLWGGWQMRDGFARDWLGSGEGGGGEAPADATDGNGSGLIQTGIYRTTRHPQYLGTLLMIWSGPDLTTDRLAFNILWSGWVVVGAWLEERDLIDQFGQAYRDYQRAVPMLLPRPWKCRSEPDQAESP